MSLFNFSGEGVNVNYNPVRGLVRELRAEANKREEEEEERVQTEREVRGKGMSRMEERMSQTRKTWLGRGLSIMNQVLVVEQREPGNRCCCVCQ